MSPSSGSRTSEKYEQGMFLPLCMAQYRWLIQWYSSRSIRRYSSCHICALERACSGEAGRRALEVGTSTTWILMIDCMR